MKQEPISCRADNALAARCQSFAARWACVLKRPIFYLVAYIDNNAYFEEYSRTMGERQFNVVLEHFKKIVSRNGPLYRIKFLETIGFYRGVNAETTPNT